MKGQFYKNIYFTVEILKRKSEISHANNIINIGQNKAKLQLITGKVNTI